MDRSLAALHRRGAVYLVVQGLAVAAWWMALWLVPSVRRHFTARGQGTEALLAFWLPDLLLMGVGSLAAAALGLLRSPLFGHAAWGVTGVVSYASLYCLSLSLLTDSAWLSTTMMLPAMVFTGCFALAEAVPPAIYRRATPAPPGWNVVKTAGQIALVWGTTLVALPMAIVAVQRRLDLPLVVISGQLVLGLMTFTAFSSLGLWSGYTMASKGSGTPLPLDAPRVVVTAGPYAYVRNPMAIAGLGQGLSVALMTGSLLVLLYVALGGSIWQWIVRPLEEYDMEATFGSEYTRYREAVRCWIPRATSYRDVHREAHG